MAGTFRGESLHKVDAKGRVSIPALFRRVLEEADPARSPGQMAIHYAPRTPTYRIEREQLRSGPIDGRFVTLILGDLPERIPSPRVPTPDRRIFYLAEPGDASRDFYTRLHEFDGLGLDFDFDGTLGEEGVADRFTLMQPYAERAFLYLVDWAESELPPPPSKTIATDPKNDALDGEALDF